MRIVVPTTGSRGDVQPYIALGRELRRRGHSICLATHADFEELVRQHGLDFFPIEASGQALQSSDVGDRMLQAGDNTFTFLVAFARLRQPLVRQLMSACWQACAGADALVLSPTALFVSLSVAERLELPVCWTALQPTGVSRYQGSFLFPEAPDWLPGRSLYNMLTHLVSGEMLWQLMRPILNQARREVLDLPPWPPWGPVAELRRPGLRLYGYSRHVVPPPPDWGPNHEVTGYWLLEDPAYRPDPALEAFIKSGPPPVYVGFGSMHNRDPLQATQMVLDALQRSGQRGVLHTGWSGLAGVPRSEHVFPVQSVPHDWLFPRMAAIVHHGGAGTTGAALRAGVPALVVPFMSDQPFWARRVHALGAGPRPIPRRRLNTRRLAEGIRQAVEDQDLRQRAAQLGTLLDAEDGVTRAADLIEESLRPAPRPTRRRAWLGLDQRSRSLSWSTSAPQPE